MEKQTIEVPIELLCRLQDGTRNFLAMVNGMREGETRENHPDWEAVEYLEGEARLGLHQLDDFLKEKDIFLDDIDWKTVPRKEAALVHYFPPGTVAAVWSPVNEQAAAEKLQKLLEKKKEII